MSLGASSRRLSNATSLTNEFTHGTSNQLFDALKALGLYRSTAPEIVDFLLWCRAFNATQQTGKIQFAGYDHQDAYAAGNILRTFLQRLLSDASFKKVWLPFSKVRGATEETYQKYIKIQQTTSYSTADFLDHLNKITSMGSFMSEQKTKWLASGVTEQQYRYAIWALQSLEFETKKNLAFSQGKGVEGMAAREAAMTHIFLNRIAVDSNKKTIIFAHNMHIGRLANGYVLQKGDHSIAMPALRPLDDLRLRPCR